MKLLTKINRLYLFYSIILIFCFSIGLYYFISAVLEDQMDEQLVTMLAYVEDEIKDTGLAPSLSPFIDISTTNLQTDQYIFSDTAIFNPVEKEDWYYRQLEVVEKIHNQYFKIKIRKSKIESDDLLETLGIVTFILLVLLGSILFLINYLVNRSVWDKFFKNLDRMKTFSLLDKKPITLLETEISEFDNLNEVISSLTNQIITDYQNLKQFSEDAAHEMQTPVAIIKVKLESLLNLENLTDKQIEIIQSIYSSVDRLSKLNSNLVLLTKVENRQYSDVQTFELRNYIENKINDFRELIDLHEMQINSNLNSEKNVKISATLLNILINNLVSNAVNHNQKHGSININLDHNKLEISNTGIAEIPQPEKLFNRFYKPDQSTKSIGLGLSIVKKICDTNDIAIQYNFKENRHIFALTFNL